MRVLLKIISVFYLINGIIMLLVPDIWYQITPGAAHSGAMNVHFIRDIGIAFCAVSAWALWPRIKHYTPIIFIGGHAMLHMVEFLEGHFTPVEILRFIAYICKASMRIDIMDQLDLNNPDTRQLILKNKLKNNAPLVAADIAAEFGISVDTMRRDLIALEQQGLLKRVKGGALPLLPPVKPLVQRMLYKSWVGNISTKISHLLQNKQTIFLDGGTSVAEFARQLPHQYQGLVITPSPIIATILLEAQIETLLIGGRIKAAGGIAVGAQTVQDIANCTADICVLGACALGVGFGLGADDKDEADVKQQMANNASQVIIMAEAEKLHQRARHKVIDCTQVDILITNAKVEKTIAFFDQKIEVIKVRVEG